MKLFAFALKTPNKFVFNQLFVTIDPVEGRRIQELGYLIVDDDDGYQLCEVCQWQDTYQRVGHGIEHRWVLKLSRTRGCSGSLRDMLNELLTDYLDVGQLATIRTLLNGGQSVAESDSNGTAPTTAMPLNEARDAVARYYGVEPRQVVVTLQSD